MVLAVIGGVALLGLTTVSVLSQSDARRPQTRAQVNAILIGLCALAVFSSVLWGIWQLV